MPTEFGSKVETYDIEAELGRDDLTIIYNARRKSDGLLVVIRVVAPQFVFDTFFVRRFKDVVTQAMQLDHPNIVKVYEVGEKGDILYIARQHIEADTLAVYLETHGPIPVNQLVNLVKQIASALDYAHARGVKHGNLADSNIFIVDDQIWLTDFGLVAAMEGTSMVKKGFAIGDPAYLSPERVKGEGPSRRADLYALGILCYQMLTGRPPFSGEAPAVLHAQVYDQPLPPNEINRKVSPAVSEVVLRLLSKGLELRYNTGAEFAQALQAAAEGTAPIKRVTAAEDVTQATQAQKPPSTSKRFVIWLFILTPLIGLALASGFWAMSQWLSTSRQLSQQQPATPPQTAGDVAQMSGLTPIPRLADEAAPKSEAIAPTGAPAANLQPSLPTATPFLTATPETPPTPLPLPDGPVVAADSPFTNLILAQSISPDFKPVEPTNVFRPAKEPIYLFFDYNAIQAGASWSQTWKWDDVVLQRAQDTWPDEYGPVGTAWVYFLPADGFNPGPYSVLLEVDGKIVASVNFIVQNEN